MTKPKRDYPSIEYLRECFRIVDGQLVWKTRPLSHFEGAPDPEKAWNNFNRERPNKLAGAKATTGRNKGQRTVVRIGGWWYDIEVIKDMLKEQQT